MTWVAIVILGAACFGLLLAVRDLHRWLLQQERRQRDDFKSLARESHDNRERIRALEEFRRRFAVAFGKEDE